MTAPARTRRPQEVQGRPAGLVSRTVAAAADVLVALGILLTVEAGYAAAHRLLAGPPFAFPDPGPGVTAALGSATLVGYLACGWFFGGRTAGNQLMGLRVTDRSAAPHRGHRPAAGPALCRPALGAVVDPVQPARGVAPGRGDGQRGRARLVRPDARPSRRLTFHG
ncbi:RDD family protein [Streptomyces shaanxiensis]